MRTHHILAHSIEKTNGDTDGRPCTEHCLFLIVIHLHNKPSFTGEKHEVLEKLRNLLNITALCLVTTKLNLESDFKAFIHHAMLPPLGVRGLV